VNEKLNDVKKVGEFSAEVVKLLSLDITTGTPIYIGESNEAHMISSHYYEHTHFFEEIPFIISFPDFVRKRNIDGSIEFIKRYDHYVKLAVRIAGDGKYYARSIYRVRDNVIKRMLKNKTLKPLTKR